MLDAFGPTAAAAKDASCIVVDAARCWREARDCSHPTQPRLFARLVVHDCGILAPVLDSLMILCEAAMGRILCTGNGSGSSADERLLLDLLTTPELVHNWACAGRESAAALGWALRSTNIMMRMTLGHSPRTAPANSGTVGSGGGGLKHGQGVVCVVAST
jgi:hypothetical protein